MLRLRASTMRMRRRAPPAVFAQFRDKRTQQLHEGQLVGRMLLQRLATGATGMKLARYRRGPTRGSLALVRACAAYTQPCSYRRSLVLAVQCETMHGVMPAYEFRRGFCTLVLSLYTASLPFKKRLVIGTHLSCPVVCCSLLLKRSQTPS